MKKLLLTLLTAVISLSATAQREGDKITISTTESGRTTEWNLAGSSNTISSLKHTADGKMQVILKGLEAFGAWETYDVTQIKEISFSVYHAQDYSSVQLADAEANYAAKRLYNYFKTFYGQKTVSSVVANVNWNHTEADNIYKATGKYPAMNCYDFIHIYVPTNNWINYSNLTPVTEWVEAGGLVSLMWHFNVPLSETTTPTADGSGVTCTPSSTTFKAANALVDGTWENKWFYEQMDKVADVILKLQDAGIAAIWRPFHEAAGNATRTKGDWKGTAWFWWGADGAETYKQLWQTMFTYFQTKGIHNLVWTWTTQNYNGDATAYSNDDAWYPGDAYVDIVGRDLYGYTAAQQAQEFSEIQSRYPDKLVTLAECGTDVSSSAATADVAEAWNAGAQWSWFMPWYGSNMPSTDWWTKVMKEDCVITRDQVDLNQPVATQSAKEAVASMGLGFNFGNTLDSYGTWISSTTTSAYETAWGQPVTTKSMVDFLKKEGFGAVRLPVTWFQHIDADGNIDATWLDRVQEVVDYIIDNGLYCILNVHHDTGADSGDFTSWIKADKANYEANAARFRTLWTQIATRFRDYSQLLLFEGYNEMLDASSTWGAPKSTASYEALNSYAQTFVDAVRATGGSNAKRNLIVSTYAADSGSGVLGGFTLPTDNVQGHLAVEVHTYAPWDWFAQKGKWDSACTQEIEQMFERLNTAFISQGVPVVVGEYGTHGSTSVSKSSTDAQKQAAADQAACIVSTARKYGAATFYWNSIFDGTDRTVPQWTLPTVVEAMKQAYNK